MLNNLIRYFDLQSGGRTVKATGHAASDAAPVLPQYVALALGVVIEPFLRHYIETGSWAVELRTVLARLVFGLIIAIVIIPSVYRSSFDPTKPVLVQLAALFPMGLGWQSLFNAAVETGPKLAGTG
jgi:hypothetical protein